MRTLEMSQRSMAYFPGTMSKGSKKEKGSTEERKEREEQAIRYLAWAYLRAGSRTNRRSQEKVEVVQMTAKEGIE